MERKKKHFREMIYLTAHNALNDEIRKLCLARRPVTVFI
jgi:hypothetical protein